METPKTDTLRKANESKEDIEALCDTYDLCESLEKELIELKKKCVEFLQLK